MLFKVRHFLDSFFVDIYLLLITNFVKLNTHIANSAGLR